MMKRISVTSLGMAAVLAFSTMTMAAQTSNPVKDDLFNGTEVFAKGASDVTEITMDPESLGLVGGKDSKKAHSTILNVVRTYSYDKPGMYNIQDVEAFRNKLNTGEWHCSVHTRSLKTGESTDICNKQRNDGMAESAIITVEPKELTFIHTIRKKGEWESEVGEMPLMMLRGDPNLAMMDAKLEMMKSGDPNMAMMDAKLAVMTAKLQAMDGQAMSAPHGSFLLHLNDDQQSKLDSLSKDKSKHAKSMFLLKVPSDGIPAASAEPAEPAAPAEPPAPQP